MSKTVVAVTFDKVQKFIYNTIQSHKQEAQNNNETLSSVIGASRMLSHVFFEKLGVVGSNGLFSGQVSDILLLCSGSCIFITEYNQDDALFKLDELFEYYYKQHEGQLLLKYVCFEVPDMSKEVKLQAVREGKSRLKKADCLNRIIARHLNLLFDFQVSDSCMEKQQLNLQKYPHFASNINELKEKSYIPGNHIYRTSDTYFRVVVIKADLDGMGDLFKSINDYDAYKSLSDILYEAISLDSLERQAANIHNQENDFKLYPLYAAGDDILFAVPAFYLSQGIDICKGILKEINTKIKASEHCKRAGVTKGCTLSIGVDFSFNHEPIRYYYERVQEQLDTAKKAETTREAPSGSNAYNKICINGYVFYQFDKEKKEKFYESYWPHFLSGLKLLKQAVKAGFKAHHYLYGLLNKISAPGLSDNVIAYSNTVLYHLIPQYLNSNNKTLRECELLLIRKLLEQVTERKHANSTLCFDRKHQESLKKYIQLLLVFTDERFLPPKILEEIAWTNIVAKDYASIRSVVFNRVMRYLFENNLYLYLKQQGRNQRNVGIMREQFVRYTSYQASPKMTGSKQVKVYQTLHFSGSLFHRMKRRGLDIDECGELLETVNDRTREAYDVMAEERKKAHKAPPDLYFDRKLFVQMASKTGLWNQNYVDSLLILYYFKECSVIYKRLYPTGKTTDVKGKNPANSKYNGIPGNFQNKTQNVAGSGKSKYNK